MSKITEATEGSKKLVGEIEVENQVSIDEATEFFNLFKDDGVVRLLKSLVPRENKWAHFPFFSWIREGLVPGLVLTELVEVTVSRDLDVAYLQGRVVLAPDQLAKINPDLLFSSIPDIEVRNVIFGEFTEVHQVPTSEAYENVIIRHPNRRPAVTRENVLGLWDGIDLLSFRRYMDERDFVSTFTKDNVLEMINGLNALLKQAKLRNGIK